MLLTEIHNGIILFKEIAIAYCLVSELHHVCAFKSSQSHFALNVVFCRVFAKKNIHGIQHVSVTI